MKPNKLIVSPQVPRGDATRNALIRAAIAIFAREGFHAVSTRTLARAAHVNQALIGYHFSGKEGLYLAVFEYIASRLKEQIGPLADTLEEILCAPAKNMTLTEQRKRYLPPLLRLCDGMVSLMLSEETEHWAQLIMREQQQPTAAFEQLYGSFMCRVLGLLTQFVQRLRNDTDESQARLIVVGILGHVLVWRAARAGVMRHMKWETLTEYEIGQAREAVRRSVIAQIFE